MFDKYKSLMEMTFIMSFCFFLLCRLYPTYDVLHCLSLVEVPSGGHPTSNARVPTRAPKQNGVHSERGTVAISHNDSYCHIEIMRGNISIFYIYTS